MAIIDDLPGDDMSAEQKGEVLSTVMRSPHARNQPCLVRAIGRLRGENTGINARMDALLTIVRHVRNPEEGVTNPRSNAMLRALDDLSRSWGAWVGGRPEVVDELQPRNLGDHGGVYSMWGPFLGILGRIEDET
eukprot:788244-Prymnesium_polylepis.1